MWIILFLLLAVAMVLGPVLIMRPSRRTQQVADLRSQASALGLSVKLGYLPPSATSVAIYTHPWPSYYGQGKNQSWLLVKHNFNHDIHFADHWDWRGDKRPSEAVITVLKSLLGQLPEAISAVEASAGGVSCYWDESGGQTILNELHNWLDDFVTASALPSLPRPETKRS